MPSARARGRPAGVRRWASCVMAGGPYTHAGVPGSESDRGAEQCRFATTRSSTPRRSATSAAAGALGGGGRIAVGGGGLGLGGIVILLLLQLLGGGGGLGQLGDLQDQTSGAPPPRQRPRRAAARAPTRTPARTAASSATSTPCRPSGARSSRAGGRTYEPATTYFESDQWQTGCGPASTDVGPFYCPADKHVYIDLAVPRRAARPVRRDRRLARAGLRDRARVRPPHPGSAGHARLRHERQGATGRSVRTELQADCFAGVWAAHATETGLLEPITQAADRRRPERRGGRRRRPHPVGRRRARSTRRRGRTAPRGSARPGSRPATRPAT